jgi:hypothetical protein
MFRNVVGILIASATCLSAGQFTLVEFSTLGLDGSAGGPPADFGSVLGPTSLTWSGSSTATDGSYQQTYNASGSASITSLHAAVSESVTCLLSSCGAYALPSSGGSTNYQPNVTGLVWWNDVMTVNPGPGFSTLNFVFNVDGIFSQSGTANSSLASALLVGESCDASLALCNGFAGPRHITQVPITQNGTVTVSLTPWLLNQPFQYEFILAVGANVVPSTIGPQGYINGNSSSSANFSNTAQLVAVNPVNSQGNLVAGTTITSASGFSLPGPVPEPSTFGAAAAGLLLVALRYRFRVR